eukprot:695257-Pyramimonas_sp.AAC.3
MRIDNHAHIPTATSIFVFAQNQVLGFLLGFGSQRRRCFGVTFAPGDPAGVRTRITQQPPPRPQTGNGRILTPPPSLALPTVVLALGTERPRARVHLQATQSNQEPTIIRLPNSTNRQNEQANCGV